MRLFTLGESELSSHLANSLSRNLHWRPILIAGISLHSAHRQRVLVETPSHFETAAVVSNGSRILFVNSSINEAFLPLSTRSLAVSSKDCVIEPLQAGNGDFTLNIGTSLRDRACNRRAKVRGRAKGENIF